MSHKMSKMGNIILCLCELIVGILLLISPVSFTTAIIQFVGIVLIIAGAISVVQYFRTEPALAVAEQSLTRGLIEILLGCFCAFNSHWFIAVFPLLTVLYGTGILVIGIAKIQWMIDRIRLKVKRWFLMGLSAALTIVCAVLILCNPFSSVTVLWTFIAIMLIVEAVVDVIATIFAKES